MTGSVPDPEAKTPLAGRFSFLAERVGFTRHLPVPRPLGALASSRCEGVQIGIPADLSNPRVTWVLMPTLRPENENAPCGAFQFSGGEGGIRTHVHP